MIQFYSRTGGGGKVKEFTDGESDVLSRLHSEYEGGRSASKPGSDSYVGIGYWIGVEHLSMSQFMAITYTVHDF